MAKVQCVSWWLANILYGNWVEYRRINDLTEKYGNELFEAVKEFESRYSLSGYADRDKFCRYVVEARLQECQETWQALLDGKVESVRVVTKFGSPQVVLHRGNAAELVVERYSKEIKYSLKGPEIISSTALAVIAVYYLEFEDSQWKVALIDICGINDEKCIRYIKHFEEKWYYVD